MSVDFRDWKTLWEMRMWLPDGGQAPGLVYEVRARQCALPVGNIHTDTLRSSSDFHPITKIDVWENDATLQSLPCREV